MKTLSNILIGIGCVLVFYVAQAAVQYNDAGGWIGESDLDQCRPHGHEKVVIWIDGGHLECEKHEQVASMACPVRNGCTF